MSQAMHDMLVRLYELPSLQDALAGAAARGISIRRALSAEKPLVTDWVRAHFPAFAAEAEIACCRLPIACFIAVREQQIRGFACYDATAPNFFGPGSHRGGRTWPWIGPGAAARRAACAA